MTDNSGQVSSTTQAANASQVSPTTQGVKGNAGEYTADTRVSSMNDLKEKAPEVYQETLKGIAMQIVNKMRRHADRLKKLMREANRRR